jgi:hypothetical protein
VSAPDRVSDLEALRAHLRAGGVPAARSRPAGGGPDRQMRVEDPTGYCPMVADLKGARVGVTA